MAAAVVLAASWLASSAAVAIGLSGFTTWAFTAGVTLLVANSKTLRPSMPERELKDRKQTIRSATAPRTIVYGRARVSGPIVFAGSSGENNEYLHLVIPIAGHQIFSVDEIWLNDKKVELDADGFVITPPYAYTGKRHYKTKIETLGIGNHTIILEESADEVLDSVQSVAVNGLVTPNSEQALETEAIAFTQTADGVTFSLTATHTVYIDYAIRKVTGAGSHVLIKYHLGDSEQLVDDALSSEFPEWNSSHRLRGIAYLYVRLQFNQDVFPTGIPNISAVIRGKAIYDPRTQITGYSNNWALVIRDYLTSADGLRCLDAEIDEAVLIASANRADDDYRYTIDGVINLDEKPLDILNKLLPAGAGSLVYSQGVYKIYAGMEMAPVLDITEKDLWGPVKVRTRVSRTDLKNGMRAKYLNVDNHWQEAEITPISIPAYVTQDGGEDIKDEIDLPFTINSYIAYNLAMIHLKRSRQGITVELRCSWRALKLSAWDVIRLKIDHLGWDYKLFRVLEWKLTPDGIDLSLQEEAPTDWEYTNPPAIDPAPDTLLADPTHIDPPSALTISGTSYMSISKLTRPQATITWVAPSNAYVIKYEVAYKNANEPVWHIITTPDTQLTAEDRYGGVFLARVRAENALGIWSEWTDIVTTALVPGKIGESSWYAYFPGKKTSVVGALKKYAKINTTTTKFTLWATTAPVSDYAMVSLKRNGQQVLSCLLATGNTYTQVDFQLDITPEQYFTVDLSNPGQAENIGIRIDFG